MFQCYTGRQNPRKRPALPQFQSLQILRYHQDLHRRKSPSLSFREMRADETSPSISPSVYVIIVSFTASDECHTTGISYDAFTATFEPEAISTYGPGGIPNAFNFSDMPCGPNGMKYAQGKAYRPYLVAPAGLMDQMGLHEACALNSWPDPSIKLLPQRPDGPFGRLRKRESRDQKRDAVPAQITPLSPAKTPQPKRTTGRY